MTSSGRYEVQLKVSDAANAARGAAAAGRADPATSDRIVAIRRVNLVDLRDITLSLIHI